MERFQRAAALADLAENAALAVTLDGWAIALCRVEQAVHAVINQCTHAGSELASGRIRRGSIFCPLHGARFELATGACVGGTYAPLRVFATRVVDGWIEVAVPDAPPPPNTANLRAGL